MRKSILVALLALGLPACWSHTARDLEPLPPATKQIGSGESLLAVLHVTLGPELGSASDTKNACIVPAGELRRHLCGVLVKAFGDAGYRGEVKCSLDEPAPAGWQSQYQWLWEQDVAIEEVRSFPWASLATLTIFNNYVVDTSVESHGRLTPRDGAPITLGRRNDYSFNVGNIGSGVIQQVWTISKLQHDVFLCTAEAP